MSLPPESTSKSTPNLMWIVLVAALLNPTGLAEVASSITRTSAPLEICVSEGVPAT